MLYYNAENTKVFIEAIKDLVNCLGIDLVTNNLDRSYDYITNNYQDLEKLTEAILDDITSWFSGDGFNKKELCVSIYTTPWGGEFVRVQTRCKR